MKSHLIRWLIFLLIVNAFVALYFVSKTLKLPSSYTNSARYSYYVCAQIRNESEYYLREWLDHQFNVVGFKNVCLIGIEQSLSTLIRKQFPFAYVEKQTHGQEFHYCLSCFVNEPMRPEDMLMVQDIDEYLNIRKADEIFNNYDKYDIFHFSELRYGYVAHTDKEILNSSIRAINLWRKPHRYLGEYEEQNLKDLFKCKVYAGWPACLDGNGKEMIRVGAIQSLGTHFHTSKIQPVRRLRVDMRKIRLNHYMMRTKEDAVRSALKWNKLGTREGQIALNQFYRVVYDDSILESKKLI